ERLSALDREAVVGTLASERDRPARDGSLEGVVRRVARDTFLARARGDGRAELFQPADNRLVGPRRDEDVELAVGCPRHDGGGERRVAAARDRQATVTAVREAQAIDDFEPDR